VEKKNTEKRRQKREESKNERGKWSHFFSEVFFSSISTFYALRSTLEILDEFIPNCALEENVFIEATLFSSLFCLLFSLFFLRYYQTLPHTNATSRYRLR